MVPSGTAWAADLPQMQFANLTNRPPRVNAIAFQSDGKMIVGGDFSYVHGVPRAAAEIFVLPENAELFAAAIGNKVKLIWPLSSRVLQLEKTKEVASGAWVPVSGTPIRIDGFETVDVDLNDERQFFRVRELDSNTP